VVKFVLAMHEPRVRFTAATSSFGFFAWLLLAWVLIVYSSWRVRVFFAWIGMEGFSLDLYYVCILLRSHSSTLFPDC
jgi:hypothetical protein